MWLPPVIVEPPTQEPVAIVNVRQFLRIAEDDTSFDGELTAMLGAARAQVEAITGTPLITRTIRIAADSFADLDRLPIGPVIEVAALTFIDTNGDEQELETGFELFGAGLEQGVRRFYGTAWPTARAQRGAVTLELKVGYGTTPAHVPEPIRTAILLLIGDWFRNREDTNVGNITTSMPNGVQALLTNYRIWL